MRVEQAIFTSVRGKTFDGYQLASSSAGLSSDILQELSQWGPAHDSLQVHHAAAFSINSHRLSDGSYCVSRSSHAGEEYSGRGGYRVYTQCLIVSPSGLARFANSPFRLLEAVTASGHMRIFERIPERLESVQIIGRGSLLNRSLLSHMIKLVGLEPLLQLVQLTIASDLDTIGVVSCRPIEQVFAAVFNLLPLTPRAQISFSTGLRPAKTREFRLLMLADDDDVKRQFLRESKRAIADLSAGSDGGEIELGGWTTLLQEVIQHHGLMPLQKILQQTADTPAQELDGAVRHIRRDFSVAV